MRPFEASKKIEHYLCPLLACRFGEEDGQLRARNFSLYAGGEGLHSKDTGLELVFAEDDHAAGSLVSDFKGFLEAEAYVAPLYAEALAAEFAGQGKSGGVERFPKRGDIGVCQYLRGGSLLSQQGEHKAVFAHCEPDARRPWPAKHLAQAVVASAAEECVLCAKTAVCEFEGGAGVVVQATDKTVVTGVVDGGRIESREDLCEMGAGSLIKRICDDGERVDDGLVGGDLAVEDADGVGGSAALAVDTHVRNNRVESGTKFFVVAGAVGGGANGVKLQLPTGDAQFVEECGQHLKDFGVAERAFATCGGRANDFCADLRELAVTTLLRALAAELRADVKELLKLAGFAELVLDIGADHASSVFRAEGEGLSLFRLGAGAVFPRVHLLGGDVGF